MTDKLPDETHVDGSRRGTADEPGQAIGRFNERSTETIPGGIDRDDERVSALDTQSTGVGAPGRRGQPEDEPSGHREGEPASDDRIREAGDRQ
jgi:hypothetical protein